MEAIDVLLILVGMMKRTPVCPVQSTSKGENGTYVMSVIGIFRLLPKIGVFDGLRGVSRDLSKVDENILHVFII